MSLVKYCIVHVKLKISVCDAYLLCLIEVNFDLLVSEDKPKTLFKCVTTKTTPTMTNLLSIRNGNNSVKLLELGAQSKIQKIGMFKTG